MPLFRRLLGPFLSRQFLVFLVVGATCAVANFGVGALVRMVSTSPAGYAASVTLGFTVGSIASFVLNRRYTFAASDQPARPQAIRFTLVTLVSIALAALVAEVLLKALNLLAGNALSAGQKESLAHLVAIGVNTVYGFVAMKFFAMRAPSRAA